MRRSRPSRRRSDKHKATKSASKWSARVTRESHALALEEGVFKKRSAREIARSLKRSADRSRARKADPYRSALSMLTFYINRAGKNLPAGRRHVLQAAKDELRALYRRTDRTRRA
jgi:hypothetical protein